MSPLVLGLLGPRTTWYVARASGLTAWCLVVLSVALGLVMSSKPAVEGPASGLAARPAPLPWFAGALLHRAARRGAHGRPVGTVPCGGRARPVRLELATRAVAGGVVGLYLLVAVEVTSLLMRKLPRRWWHRIHLSSLVLLVAATVHGLQSGSDMGNQAVETGWWSPGC